MANEDRFGNSPRGGPNREWESARGDQSRGREGRFGNEWEGTNSERSEYDRGGYGREPIRSSESGFGHREEFGGGYSTEGYGTQRPEQGLGGGYGYGSQRPESGYGGGFGSQGGYGSEPSISGSSWKRPGRGMRGRGPKGFQRSDERIQEIVSEALEQDDDVDASNIEVSVIDCVVTLSGNVEDRNEKRRAEDLVESLPGVKEVQNQLRIGSGNLSGQEKSFGSRQSTGTSKSAKSGTELRSRR